MNLDLLLEDLNVDAMNADVKDVVEDVIANVDAMNADVKDVVEDVIANVDAMNADVKNVVEDVIVIVEETRMISLEETFSQVKKEKEKEKGK